MGWRRLSVENLSTWWEKRMWPGWCLRTLLAWLVPSIGNVKLLRTVEDISVSCVTGCRGGWHSMAPALIKAYVIEEGLNVWQWHQTILSFARHERQVTAASAGAVCALAEHPWGWDPHLPTLMWQMVLIGSPAPVPSLQWVSKTYSSLNWESVTNLNCFSDLIRIFHL